MFKDKEILEELKQTNKKLDRVIAMQNVKRLKDKNEESSNELAWFILIILLLESFNVEE